MPLKQCCNKHLQYFFFISLLYHTRCIINYSVKMGNAAAAFRTLANKAVSPVPLNSLHVQIFASVLRKIDIIYLPWKQQSMFSFLFNFWIFWSASEFHLLWRYWSSFLQLSNLSTPWLCSSFYITKVLGFVLQTVPEPHQEDVVQDCKVTLWALDVASLKSLPSLAPSGVPPPSPIYQEKFSATVS